MTEHEGQFYCEFSYKRHAEGRTLLMRALFVLLYLLFAVGYFGRCYFSRFIPMFALCPIFVWMLVYFTWRYVSHDYYFEFRSGLLTLGTLMRKKKRQVKTKKVEIRVKEAEKIMPLPSGRVKLSGVTKLIDFSGSVRSDKRIAVIYNTQKGRCALVIECTPPLLKLIFSYYGKTDELLEFSNRL